MSYMHVVCRSALGAVCWRSLCQDYYGQLGDWYKVGQELAVRFGFGTSTMKRWVRAAQGMDPELLAALGAEEYERIKGTAVWDNQYLCGHGVSSRSRLSTPYARKALRILLDHDPPSKVFLDKICAPLKVLEVWDKLNRKRYGSVCELSSAYSRLLERLQEYEGLQLVANVMATNTPLNGTSPSNPGIAECHFLVREFERCRAGGLPPPARVPTADELTQEEARRRKEAEEKAQAEQVAKEEAEARAREQAQVEELEQGWLNLATPMGMSTPGAEASLRGPPSAEQAAAIAAEEDLARVKFCPTPDNLVAAASASLQACSRAAVLIAAPTSGWTAISNYMKTAADLVAVYKDGGGSAGGQHRMRIVILTGGRFEIIGKVHEKAKALFPNHGIFVTVLLRQAKQTWGRRPCYAVTLAEKADCGSMPASIIIRKASAKQAVQESLGLRCHRETCCWYTPSAAGAAEPEIDAEDRDASSLELLQAELAAEEGEDGDEAPGVSAGASSVPDGVFELWPFAFSTHYWASVLTSLLEADKAQVIAILSPSAHPGPWVVGRRLSMDVFVSTRRHSAHAHKHAVDLGKNLRLADMAPAQELGVSAGPSGGNAQVQTIRAEVASNGGVLEAYDVAPGGLWRDGINLTLAGDSFAKASARLVSEQLDAFGLAISAAVQGSGRGLESTRLLREGDCIPASSLFFDEEALLVAWLKLAGNDRYRDRIVCIPGVMKQGEPRDIFAVLVGAVQFANCFTGIRRSPNAKLVFHPMRGFNEGGLELRISTRNQAGVGQGSPILLDYGPAWVPPAVGGSECFRGALDAIFEQQKEHLPVDALEHEAACATQIASEEQAARAFEVEAKRKATEDLERQDAKRLKAEQMKEEEVRVQISAQEARAAIAAADSARPGCLLGTVSSPLCEFRFVARATVGGAGVSASAPGLLLHSLENASKKVPKNTVLAHWKEHTMLTTKSLAGPTWAVQPKDHVYVKEVKLVMPMAKAMKEHYSTIGQILGYNAWPPGAAPKSYSPAAGKAAWRLDLSKPFFDANRQDIFAAIEAARVALGLRIVWVVKQDLDKMWVRPCGIAIALVDAVTLPAQGFFRFEEAPQP